MPYKKINVKHTIDDVLKSDPELNQMWDATRTEYKVLGDLVKLRREKGLTQTDLARESGNKQQAISRIENKENSPTLKTLCSLLDVLGYDIVFIPRR